MNFLDSAQHKILLLHETDPIPPNRIPTNPHRSQFKITSGLHAWNCPVPDLNPTRTRFTDSFVEWDVRAPLEVIYEEYEGDDAEETDGVSQGKRESEMQIIQRYASLSLFYPESDSDTSSEGDFPTDGNWDSPDNMCFRWEEEDDRDGLIEIALDEKRNSEVEEENLIEIDLSPAR
ncbi:UNVERIFIED_CONTAM: hypothetical protein Slati_2005700 [Sesamum latifolium]|uniref:Uncharacterized protein n=1 Tax=Sesamum latifolium TaxID=2727402 RepID=A0AAW2WRX4_9LAMI